MKQFDLISDLHLDFWIKNKGSTKEDNLLEIDLFVDSILPEEISKVLVIAGDLGHNNEQNFEVLKSLRRYYEHILVVAGNGYVVRLFIWYTVLRQKFNSYV